MNARTVAGVALAFIAVFGLPRGLTVSQVPASPVQVAEPSDAWKAKVQSVRTALASATPAERAVWSAVWTKAAVVAAAPESEPPVLVDTRSLRALTVASLDIAWRRLAGNQPGRYPRLRDAVEAVMRDAVGLEVRPASPELKKAYAEACRAIAWAGA